MKYLKIVIALLILAIIGMGVAIYLNIATEEVVKKNAEYNSVSKICELATLKCYYHNVASNKQESNKLFKIGYKKYWVEYSGVVEIGIKDSTKIQINESDENNVVKIYVPDVEVLNIDSDKMSIGDPITDTGAFTKITSEDKTTAYSAAQTEMKEKVAEDIALLSQAKNNAKKLLEQYVINVSKQLGQEVTVEWLDEPIVNN